MISPSQFILKKCTGNLFLFVSDLYHTELSNKKKKKKINIYIYKYIYIHTHVHEALASVLINNLMNIYINGALASVLINFSCMRV